MLAVVLSFDRFPLGVLGCYGNSSVATACFDHIAASSVVFDQHFGEDFSPTPSGHAWWTGCYHFPRPGTDWLARMPSLPNRLAAGGVGSTWITDEAPSPHVPLPREATVVEASDFDEIIQRGEELIEAWSSQPETHQLIWLKVGESVWDFERLPEMEWSEDEDVLVSEVLESERMGNTGVDWSPAHWEVYRDLVETTVEELDTTLYDLWDRVLSVGERERVLFLISSARGMLLGSRAQLPTTETSWVEDSVHLPLIGFHSSHSGGERHLPFTQSTDLPATLLDYFACPSSNGLEGRSFLPVFLEEASRDRESLTYGSQGSWGAVRTREFYCVRIPEGNAKEPRHLLFMKPEDLWDWHDVSAQEPEMTETLSQKLDTFTKLASDQLPVGNAWETKPPE